MAASQIQILFFDLGDTLVTAPKTWLPGAKALLASLSAKAIPLGIISNTTGLPNRAAILNLLPTDFDLGFFDPNLVLFSSEVGIDKPNKAIFQLAVTRAAKPAATCLYVSENIVETLVAQHAGLRSLRVQVAPNNDLASLEQNLAKFELAI